MPTAPTLTIDGSGVLHWTNPTTPPTNWVVSAIYSDHTWNGLNFATYSLSGSLTSWDAHATGVKGGLTVSLSGRDALGNVIYQPSFLTGALTKNQ